MIAQYNNEALTNLLKTSNPAQQYQFFFNQIIKYILIQIEQKTDMNSTLLKTSILNSQKMLRKQYLNPKYLSVAQMMGNLENNKSNFIVEICKKTPQLFNKSVWVGNRIGGMSTWLSTLKYQLPYKNFYVFMEKQYVDDEGLYDYFDNFFKRTAYKNYLGLCVGNRNEASYQKIHTVQSLTYRNLIQAIEAHPKTLLLDVRGTQQVQKNPVTNLPESVQYRNIPLDHDQLAQKFQQAISRKDLNTQIITMCARGYRGTIAYSLFRHMMKSNPLNIYACQSKVEEINQVFKKCKENK